MVFSSLIFVFLFLPINLLLYKIAPSIRVKNAVMLVFSLIFYAWGDPVCLLLLVGMTFADWLISLYIEKCKAKGKSGKSGLWMMAVVNLGLLGFFKYTTFFLSNINAITGFPQKIPEILLPIGISFYTFQLISYVVDVYRGEVPAQKKFFRLLLYVSLFHQCIAGPIVRYRDVEAELEDRYVSANDLYSGIWRFCVGLAKKAVLANACANVADSLMGSGPLSENVTVTGLWIGMLAFALQIYLDFSAYSDMAIGMGRMIGIHYLENFNYPYISNSVTEFWRRWHMSLGSFFRDYVYIPLGGNRKGVIRTIINLFIVWFLTGFWHGASWNFVFWGLYFFVFLMIEKLFLLKLCKKCKVFGVIYLLIVVYLGWILFRFESVSDILEVFKGIFGFGGHAFWNVETRAIVVPRIAVLVFSIIASTPIFKIIGEKFYALSFGSGVATVFYGIGKIVIPVVLLLLSAAALAGDSYNPFLYFRF